MAISPGTLPLVAADSDGIPTTAAVLRTPLITNAALLFCVHGFSVGAGASVYFSPEEDLASLPSVPLLLLAPLPFSTVPCTSLPCEPESPFPPAELTELPRD